MTDLEKFYQQFDQKLRNRFMPSKISDFEIDFENTQYVFAFDRFPRYLYGQFYSP